MKVFVEEVLEKHLLGLFPYKKEEEVVQTLEERDPSGKKWSRQRLAYQLERVKCLMLKVQRAGSPERAPGKRQAQGSPSKLNITEVIEEDEPTTTINPLGGRPQGTTIAASRENKRANRLHLDSATRAWAEESKTAGLGRLKEILIEKHQRYRALFPDSIIHPLQRSTISSRVSRHGKHPNQYPSREAHGISTFTKVRAVRTKPKCKLNVTSPQCLLDDPEVIRTSADAQATLTAATDAALAAAGPVNAEVLELEGIRRLAQQRQNLEARTYHGLTARGRRTAA